VHSDGRADDCCPLIGKGRMFFEEPELFFFYCKRLKEGKDLLKKDAYCHGDVTNTHDRVATSAADGFDLTY
jgi:hypothetical protein